MANGIRVNPGELRSSGSRVRGIAGAYQSKVNDIFQEIENLQAVWQGADNLAYTEQLNSYKGNIIAVGNATDNYGIFLIETANRLQRLQADNAEGATRL